MDADDQQEHIRRFWRGYLAHLKTQGVQPRQLPWYRLRARQYIESSDMPLRQHAAAQVKAWHERLCNQAGLADWQVLQAIDAVEHLLRFARTPASSKVDWQALRDAARRLASQHPTLARQEAPLPDDLPAWKRRLIGEIRRRGYSWRTEQAYLQWLERLCQHAESESPDSLDGHTVRTFLEALVVRRNVSASTQNQALNACAFYFKQILDRPLELGPFAHAKRPKRLPVVLTVQELGRLLSRADGIPGLIITLAVRHRHAAHGGSAVAGSGPRFRLSADHRAARQGRQGPSGALPCPADGSPARAPGGCQGASPAGSGRRPRRDPAARCPGEEVSECQQGMALAVGVPQCPPVCRSSQRHDTPASYARVFGAAGNKTCRRAGGHRQAGRVSHATALLRHTPVGTRW